MKNIFVILLVMLSGLSFGQQKKTKKAPPIKAPKLLPPPEVKANSYITEADSKKCYIYKFEEQKDALTYVTENLFEYGWAGSNARLVITTYNYDPVKKKELEKDGEIQTQSQSLHFIDGKYKIEKNILNFTPDKSENYENRTFKLIYKPKTQKVESLKDENDHPYKKGECLQPMISI